MSSYTRLFPMLGGNGGRLTATPTAPTAARRRGRGVIAAAVAAGIVSRQIVEDFSDNVKLWKSVTDEPLAD
ncbi:DLW-39 family protein [Schaalia hyovaginalis]|uniref:DLW-39 family protein n=1 Tax=Schaalia hyovaginalis TaxID=29316 RepID=UPI00139BDD11|nr:hypothetical protein [Schaalia hyovaginalis]